MPSLTLMGWLRWAWTQLTSMRTALLLLLLLAVAAVPGSLVPQRSSNPNGVVQIVRNDPARADIYEAFQLFDVYSSVWFSAIYLLLFTSLIGCVIPRARHHIRSLRTAPPITPKNLSRLPGWTTRAADATSAEQGMHQASSRLRRMGYRVIHCPEPDGSPATFSVSAERGYLRETGNLVFHVALVGILVTLAVGSGFVYNAQRVIVEGESFATSRATFDSLTSGRFFTEDQLISFAMTLDNFQVRYSDDPNAPAAAIVDYAADVRIDSPDLGPIEGTIRVNQPLAVDDTEIYLLGNGYAPQIIVRNPEGDVVFSEKVAFLPQDSNLTSLGIVKVPDGLAEQVGMTAMFYPTRAVGENGASYSAFTGLIDPVLTVNVFTGDLGLDSGAPRSVYALDTDDLTQLAGRGAPEDALELRPGDTVDLPNGLGSIEFGEISRFASFDVARDPTRLPMLILAILTLLGLGAGLFIPRRRMWVRASRSDNGIVFEYAALARGDDPTLDEAVRSFADNHQPSNSAPDPTDRKS